MHWCFRLNVTQFFCVQLVHSLVSFLVSSFVMIFLPVGFLLLLFLLNNRVINLGQVKKMMFVSIWFSFAISLFILNTQHKRLTYDQIPNFNYWKGCVLFLTGFIGGLILGFRWFLWILDFQAFWPLLQVWFYFFHILMLLF